MLKIDALNETVTLLDTELPEAGEMWRSGALAQDGCIYFMPYNARRILQFDPEDESAVSVGEDLGDQHEKYENTVLSTNGWMYGIPNCSNRIVRFNPADRETSTAGQAFDIEEFGCDSCVLGRDGFIYAANLYEGWVLIIDVVNNSYSIIENVLTDGDGDASTGRQFLPIVH